MTDNQFDINLEDNDLLKEIELVTNLIVAATQAAQRLTQSQVDEILGVIHPSY